MPYGQATTGASGDASAHGCSPLHPAAITHAETAATSVELTSIMSAIA